MWSLTQRIAAKRVLARSTTSRMVRWHGGSSVPDTAPTIDVTFLLPDGSTRKTVQARVGESFLETAHRNDIDLEGACEGVCACSTCHLIFPLESFDSLPEPSEDEEDMLDMAFGLTETSRLGCQVTVTEEMEGMVSSTVWQLHMNSVKRCVLHHDLRALQIFHCQELEMPKATRNFYVDGHVPQPH